MKKLLTKYVLIYIQRLVHLSSLLNMEKKRLCLIDTDSGFVRVLEKRLEAAGWERRIFAAPPRIEELVAIRIDALLVDVIQLGPRAWEFLEQACGALPDVGVVVCTERSSVRQRVRGLNLGADDWITKPCHPEEVVARLEAVVRRRKRRQVRKDVGPLVVGELEIRPDQYQAFVGGRSAELTKREFELIQLLAEARGRVAERREIYQRVWGYTMARGDRSVDVFVRKVRKKLERLSPGWSYIHTHFGIGYRLEVETLSGANKEVDPAHELEEESEVEVRDRVGK